RGVVERRRERQEVGDVRLNVAGLFEGRREHPVEREREQDDDDDAGHVQDQPPPASRRHATASRWRSSRRMYGTRTNSRIRTITIDAADATPYWAPAMPFR